MMSLGSHVADIGHVVGLVGQHEASLFAPQHQPLIARRIAGVGLQEAVAAEEPEISRARNRRRGSPIDFPVAIFRLVIEQQEIDFRRFEPRHHHVLTQVNQVGEFDLERLFVPLSGFAEAVERD